MYLVHTGTYWYYHLSRFQMHLSQLAEAAIPEALPLTLQKLQTSTFSLYVSRLLNVHTKQLATAIQSEIQVVDWFKVSNTGRLASQVKGDREASVSFEETWTREHGNYTHTHMQGMVSQTLLTE
jgi:hypothetical protein